MAQVYCPQCEAIAVNGVPCHEHGCPNSRRRWIFRGRGEDKVCIPANKNEGVPAWLMKSVGLNEIDEDDQD